MILTVIQFVFGTLVHLDRLGKDFLMLCIPSLLYAIALAKLVDILLPDPVELSTKSLTKNFMKNIRPIYGLAFLLGLIPFVIAGPAFGDELTSPTQTARIIFMVCFAVGFFTPAKLRLAHLVLAIVALPVVTAFIVYYSMRAGG